MKIDGSLDNAKGRQKNFSSTTSLKVSSLFGINKIVRRNWEIDNSAVWHSSSIDATLRLATVREEALQNPSAIRPVRFVSRLWF